MSPTLRTTSVKTPPPSPPTDTEPETMHEQILVCAVLALTACGSSTPTPDPCPDCEGADDMPAEPITDLPCGGADLQNDDLNCGACGNECPVEYADGPFEAGNCNGGKCGPRWFAAFLGPDPGNDVEAPQMTCEEVCADFEAPCVERGCAGLTGY